MGPVVVYKIMDPNNYLIMKLDRKILRGIFEHKRLKPAVIRTNQGNVQNLAELRQIMNTNFKVNKIPLYSVLHHSDSMKYNTN